MTGADPDLARRSNELQDSLIAWWHLEDPQAVVSFIEPADQRIEREKRATMSAYNQLSRLVEVATRSR